MTDTDEATPPDHDGLLEELERTLTEQLALAEREDFEAMDGSQAALGALLARASALEAPMPPQCRDRLERIRQLHRRLVLTLNDSRRDTSDKLRHMQQGRKTLGAYRDGGV